MGLESLPDPYPWLSLVGLDNLPDPDPWFSLAGLDSLSYPGPRSCFWGLGSLPPVVVLPLRLEGESAWGEGEGCSLVPRGLPAPASELSELGELRAPCVEGPGKAAGESGDCGEVVGDPECPPPLALSRDGLLPPLLPPPQLAASPLLRL